MRVLWKPRGPMFISLPHAKDPIMRALFASDFTLRFAGGFALGAVAVAGTQLIGWLGTLARVV